MPKKIWRPLKLNFFVHQVYKEMCCVSCGYGGRHIPSKWIQAPYYVKHRIWSGNVCLLYALSFMHKKNPKYNCCSTSKISTKNVITFSFLSNAEQNLFKWFSQSRTVSCKYERSMTCLKCTASWVPHPLKETKRETFFHGLLSSPSLSSENELLEEVSSPILFWIPLQDIQCEKFIWNESVSLLVYASWYNLNTCTLKLRVNKTNLSYARCEKPLKNHSLDVAKKCVESYSSSNTAGQYPKKKGKLTWLHY